ncbi:MAG: AAA family ATPase [Gammaproteobacteria bacterium]|nr:AAA family ATPase [Gammaproteobacteria bacterium]
MPVIAFVGNKGGAGKTTLAVNMGAGLARHAETAIVDADPQGSSVHWYANSDEVRVTPVFPAESELLDQIRDLKAKFAYVIADCPPSVHAPQTDAILKMADVALVPVQPSPVDLWATVHIEQAIAEAKQINPALHAVLVVNQLESRSTLSQLIREALAEIAVPVANTVVRKRAVYKASALEGRTVFDMGKRGADAAKELDQLIKEVIRP